MASRWSSLLKLLSSRRSRAPLYLLLGASASSAATAITLQEPPGAARLALDGALRSSRALYTITVVVVDYKYSLRGFDATSSRYRAKLSEIHLRSARRILRLCEANKGFYVKAGQFVSSLRQIPKEYTSTLSCLQDQAVPCCFKDIKEVIVKNLGKDLSEIFVSFDEEPIAAASVAQVHHAHLKDNQEVAIKVQYPGLEERMKVDISTMNLLSKFVARIFPDYRLEKLVAEFERAMSMELDFVQEAKNSERTANNFQRNKSIQVPSIFWEFSTKQVLTMQFCKGYKIDDLDSIKKSGISPLKVAKTLMELFAEMIFVHGFLHGDPHPGNILVSPQDHGNFSIVILDHGIYKELDTQFRLGYCQLWKALILLDSQKIQHIGKSFGVGKYARYFPVIFTGRTMGSSKSALGTRLSIEEKRNLKHELKSLKMGDISTFMESLPQDFFAILRTDGLLRSIISKLGAPRHVRLLAYAKYASLGLAVEPKKEAGYGFQHALSRMRANISHLYLRMLLEILELLTKLEEFGQSILRELKWTLIQALPFFNRSFFLSWT